VENTLFLTVNLTNEGDRSGLPIYYREILPLMDNQKIKVININAIANQEPTIITETFEGHEILTFISDSFLEGGDKRLLNEIMGKIVTLKDMWGLKAVVYPDYLFSNYIDLKYLEEIGVDSVMFIHLLNRGMLNEACKQPYFQKLGGSLEYLTNSSYLEWTVVRQTKNFICNSKSTAYDLKRYYEAETNGKRIDVVQLGVNKDSFQYQSLPETKKVMYFGRLSAQKGVYYITKDIAQNYKRYQENPIIMAGEGELESGILKAWFYDKTVEWVGNLSKKDLIEKLKEVKYCIFPSIYEPWCLALNEALAMGKICIVQEGQTGMTEQVIQGVNGFHFDFVNESIIDFIDHLETMDLKDISLKARESASELEDHVLRLEKVL
jgi:glycosyltransferase involved in cell wall biosynthesis